jgi:hypothetical protein
MVDHSNEIYQLHDSQETPEDDVWRSYNSLVLGHDYSRIRKLLVRYRLFEMSLGVPGDIIECGVFKGVGLMYWAKPLEIFTPNSRKRVIGFDVFGPFKQVALQVEEINVASRHDQIAKHINMNEIAALVEAAGLTHRVELVEGDITYTSYAYVAGHYGLRISILHLDLDTYAGTKAALTAFWPIVSRGGCHYL